VDADRGEDEAARERGRADEVAAAAAEGEGEAGDDEPGQERQARDSRLRRDGDRRVVRRAGPGRLRAQVGLLRVGVLERADADADDRVVLGDLDPVSDELRAAARDAVDSAVRPVEECVAHIRRRCCDQKEHGRADEDKRDRATAPGEGRGEHDARDQRGEARL